MSKPIDLNILPNEHDFSAVTAWLREMSLRSLDEQSSRHADVATVMRMFIGRWRPNEDQFAEACTHLLLTARLLFVIIEEMSARTTELHRQQEHEL